MDVGYLAPVQHLGDAESDTVVLRLFDRRPDLSPHGRLNARRGAPAPVVRLLGTCTIEFSSSASSDDGKDQLVSVHLQTHQPFQAAELHQFPWSRVITAASTHRRARRSNQIAHWQEAARAQAELDASVVVAQRGPGRPAIPLTRYALIADRYRELVTEGVTNPTQTIAEESGVPRPTAASWIRRARQHGLLDPGTPGRVG